MLHVISRKVSDYGFFDHVAKPCPECGNDARMMIVTGEEEGKFGAFQVECTNCKRCSPLAIFFKFDTQGNLTQVDPSARYGAEAYWNIMVDKPGGPLPPFKPEDYSLFAEAWADEDAPLLADEEAEPWPDKDAEK